MAFGAGPPKPIKPPTPPTQADASVRNAGLRQSDSALGYASFVSTSSTGLKRKDKTSKSTLIGGA